MLHHLLQYYDHILNYKNGIRSNIKQTKQNFGKAHSQLQNGTGGKMAMAIAPLR